SPRREPFAVLARPGRPADSARRDRVDRRRSPPKAACSEPLLVERRGADDYRHGGERSDAALPQSRSRSEPHGERGGPPTAIEPRDAGEAKPKASRSESHLAITPAPGTRSESEPPRRAKRSGSCRSDATDPHASARDLTVRRSRRRAPPEDREAMPRSHRSGHEASRQANDVGLNRNQHRAALGWGLPRASF